MLFFLDVDWVAVDHHVYNEAPTDRQRRLTFVSLHLTFPNFQHDRPSQYKYKCIFQQEIPRMASTSTRILCLMRTDSAFPRSAEWRTVPFIKTLSCSIVFCVYCLSSALFRWPNKCLPSFDNCQHLSSIDNFLQTTHEIVPRLAQPFVIKNRFKLLWPKAFNFFDLSYYFIFWL